MPYRNIERDGVDGVVIVLRGSVAAGLLSEDNLSFGWAASALLGQLARLGAMALINRVFEGGVTEGDLNRPGIAGGPNS